MDLSKLARRASVSTASRRVSFTSMRTGNGSAASRPAEPSHGSMSAEVSLASSARADLTPGVAANIASAFLTIPGSTAPVSGGLSSTVIVLAIPDVQVLVAAAIDSVAQIARQARKLMIVITMTSAVPVVPWRGKIAASSRFSKSVSARVSIVMIIALRRRTWRPDSYVPKADRDAKDCLIQDAVPARQ